jgi:hypothetical protein
MWMLREPARGPQCEAALQARCADWKKGEKPPQFLLSVQISSQLNAGVYEGRLERFDHCEAVADLRRQHERLAEPPCRSTPSILPARTTAARRDREGRPDTIERLEQLMRALRRVDDRRHSAPAIFVDRPGESVAPDRIDTFLDVHVPPAMPLACSSIAARLALCTGKSTEALTSVPYSTFARDSIPQAL